MDEKYKLTKKEQDCASDSVFEVAYNLVTRKTYKYKIVESCPICGRLDEAIIISVNPDKKRMTPFREDDTTKFTCGHTVKSLGLTVKKIE
jgi:hypothetical protein